MSSFTSEKARWALERSKVDFEEDGHVPLLKYFTTYSYGGRSVPLLVIPPSAGAGGPNRVLTDSRDILQWCYEEKGATWLYPNEESRELEKYFSDQLGPVS